LRGQWFGLVVVVGVLAGCSGEQTALPVADSPAPSIGPTAAGAAPTAVPTATPIPPGVLDEYGQPVQTFTEPVWDQASTTAVLDAAVVAVQAFARPDVPYEQWWADLSPLLSPQAQIDYQYVDPVNVPARGVTGEPVLVDDDSASVAGVQVPTDVGLYLMTLSRADADAPWVVERITPPSGL